MADDDQLPAVDGVAPRPADDRPALGELFWAVARELRHLSRQSLAPWDVAPSHSRALGVLARHGPVRLAGLAEHLRIAARSATEVVDGLAERGLVERRPDPGDRRAVLVQLTEEGTRVASAIRGARAVEADAYFAVLAPGDRAELARILGVLLRR